MTKQNPKCVYCNNENSNNFQKKAHILSQFMGNFQPDLFFQGDIVCDQCNEKMGETIEKHFSEKSFEGLIARLLLRRNKGKQSPVILYDSSLLKISFHTDSKVDFDPLFLLISSALDKAGSTKDPIMLLKKGNAYAIVFAEEVSNLKSQNTIKKLRYKIKDFRKGTETVEWVGNREDSLKIVQIAMTNLGLKAESSTENVNDDSQPPKIKSNFIAVQDVEINSARFIAKVAFEYFAYCANKSGALSSIFSEELRPVRDFIKAGAGNAKSFVSVGKNNFISKKIKQGNNHYFVAFESVRGVLIGKVSFMDTIAYQVDLGTSPFSLANNRIGNGHAFNLSERKMKRMYAGSAPLLSNNDFSIYNKG